VTLVVARHTGREMGVIMIFVDRADAERRIAARLRHLQGADVVVLGLPRGGVPVAFEVAQELVIGAIGSTYHRPAGRRRRGGLARRSSGWFTRHLTVSHRPVARR